MECGKKHRDVHGVTLIELMVYLAIAAILLTVATPVLLGWRGRTELVAATDLLRADMKMAMSVSAKQNEPVVMKFQVGAQSGEWCYALYKGGHCDCFQPEVCSGVEALLQRSHTDFTAVALTPAVVTGKFTFQPNRRTVTAGNVQLTNSQGLGTKIVVSGYGRIRVCSPAGTGHVDGYASC